MVEVVGVLRFDLDWPNSEIFQSWSRFGFSKRTVQRNREGNWRNKGIVKCQDFETEKFHAGKQLEKKYTRCQQYSLEIFCLFVFSNSRDCTFSTAHLLFLMHFFPQCYFVVCLLKGQWRRMQPKHTEALFILAAAGLLQGHDPEGMKNRAAIQLTSVTLPGVKSPGTWPNTCVFTVQIIGTVNYRG